MPTETIARAGELSLSSEQTDALDRINRFLADKSRQVFQLVGLAGSGKSTLLAAVAAQHPNALLAAPTGKAASVLASKAGRPARTLHKVLYRPFLKDNVLYFQPTFLRGALSGSLLLLDESSLVSQQLGNDLVTTGAKIVSSGDSGQLPPVHGRPFFNRPDAELTTIHRQALESAILRQAHAARETGCYRPDGAQFQVDIRPTDDDYLAADVVLVWTNETKHRVTERIRRLRGYRSPFPQAGEVVVCLRNKPSAKLYNGATYTLTRPFDPAKGVISAVINGTETSIPNCSFQPATDKCHGPYSTPFEFGYAMTVHKAQGSEWDKVILIDEFRGDDRRRWLYTGFTRAARSVLVVRMP